MTSFTKQPHLIQEIHHLRCHGAQHLLCYYKACASSADISEIYYMLPLHTKQLPHKIRQNL